MSWASFWFPNIVQATLFAGISAVVGTVVGLGVRWAWRKWGKPWVLAVAAEVLTEQKATTAAANVAVAEARKATEHASTAAVDAKAAGANSKTTTARLDLVGRRLVDVLAENQGMAKRLDDLLSAYLRLHNIAREQGVVLPPNLDPADLDLEETQALTITGRHNLHDPGHV